MFETLENLTQAREAEALTMEYERNRLKVLGIDKEPQWMGLDDCFAGYDVLSYDPEEFAPVNRMIGVKFATVPSLQFILTRDEWEQAQKFGAAYLFHVWNMQKALPDLHELTLNQIRPHIPTDNGNGRWMTVDIPLDL